MEGLRSKLVGTLRTSSKQQSQSLYITQDDLDAAVMYLNSNEYNQTMPKTWHERMLINWISEELPSNVNWNTTIQISSGIYGHVVPLASHFIGAEDEERYLLMLTFRVTAPKLDSLVTIRTLKS
ncbi:hypothetical protein DA098_09980 [Vibrio parahaemolyticus]|jgi:hypothetical protein|nr:hypothetical protein [Vibrio parahaemolyticus]TMX39606.1 hypothetical protein DA098_09980 [Vibrio parahaemolyticus]TMX80327.1 hypothetical protein DA094_01995 [Vibrio parahaemolyticus]